MAGKWKRPRREQRHRETREEHVLDGILDVPIHQR